MNPQDTIKRIEAERWKAADALQHGEMERFRAIMKVIGSIAYAAAQEFDSNSPVAM